MPFWIFIVFGLFTTCKGGGGPPPEEGGPKTPSVSASQFAKQAPYSAYVRLNESNQLFIDHMFFPAGTKIDQEQKQLAILESGSADKNSTSADAFPQAMVVNVGPHDPVFLSEGVALLKPGDGIVIGELILTQEAILVAEGRSALKLEATEQGPEQKNTLIHFQLAHQARKLAKQEEEQRGDRRREDRDHAEEPIPPEVPDRPGDRVAGEEGHLPEDHGRPEDGVPPEAPGRLDGGVVEAQDPCTNRPLEVTAHAKVQRNDRTLSQDAAGNYLLEGTVYDTNTIELTFTVTDPEGDPVTIECPDPPPGAPNLFSCGNGLNDQTKIATGRLNRTDETLISFDFVDNPRGRSGCAQRSDKNLQFKFNPTQNNPPEIGLNMVVTKTYRPNQFISLSAVGPEPGQTVRCETNWRHQYASLNPANCLLTFQPSLPAGAYDLALTLTDSEGGESTTQFTFTVDNLAPHRFRAQGGIGGDRRADGDEVLRDEALTGRSYTRKFLAEDPETGEVVCEPEGALRYGATFREWFFTWEPNDAHRNATWKFPFSCSDLGPINRKTLSARLEITVPECGGTNRVPIYRGLILPGAQLADTTTAQVGQHKPMTVQVIFSDPDSGCGDTLTTRIKNLPDDRSITAQGNEITIQRFAPARTYEVTAIAQDTHTPPGQAEQKIYLHVGNLPPESLQVSYHFPERQNRRLISENQSNPVFATLTHQLYVQALDPERKPFTDLRIAVSCLHNGNSVHTQSAAEHGVVEITPRTQRGFLPVGQPFTCDITVSDQVPIPHTGINQKTLRFHVIPVPPPVFQRVILIEGNQLRTIQPTGNQGTPLYRIEATATPFEVHVVTRCTIENCQNLTGNAGPLGWQRFGDNTWILEVVEGEDPGTYRILTELIGLGSTKNAIFEVVVP